MTRIFFRLAPPCVLFFLASPLCAGGHPKSKPAAPPEVVGPKTEIGNRWQQVAATKQAPSFQYQIAEEGADHLHLNVRFVDEVDASAWAFQVWMAEPGMVKTHRALLKEIRTGLRDAKAHPEWGSQKELISSWTKSLQTFEKESPHFQVFIAFSDTPWELPERMEQTSFEAKKAEGQQPYWATKLPVSHHLDSKSKQITHLNFDLALVSARSPHLRHPPHAYDLAVSSHLNFGLSNLAPGIEALAKLLGESSFIYRPSPNGYVLAEEASTPKRIFYSKDWWDRVYFPERWRPLEDHVLSDSEGVVAVFSGALIEILGQRLDLTKHLSGTDGDQEQTFKLLHHAKKENAHYFLLKATGPTRSDSTAGYNGSGKEVDLLLIRKDESGWQLQSEQIDSSGFDFYSRGPKSQSGSPWVWTVEGLDYFSFTLFFDPKNPSKGLVRKDQKHRNPKPLPWQSIGPTGLPKAAKKPTMRPPNGRD